jgi:hypothetical protein
VVPPVDTTQHDTGKSIEHRKNEQSIVILCDQASQFVEGEICDQEMKKDDEIDNGQVLENEVKRKGKNIVFIGVRVCREGKSSGPEVIPGGKIIMTGNRVIQGICENIVPFPDKVLVEGEVGEIQKNHKEKGKTIVHNIFRCKFPEFFLKKIPRCHHVQLENETKNMFLKKFASEIPGHPTDTHCG